MINLKRGALLFGFLNFVFLPLSSFSFPQLQQWKLFYAEPRKTYWQDEKITLGLYFPKDAQGTLTLLAKQREASPTALLLREWINAKAGETLLWELPPYTMSSGSYLLVAKLNEEEIASQELLLISPIPITHFLIGSTASPEVNAAIGATWAPLDLYNYAKLDGEGNFLPDPLTPSLFEQGVERLIANGLKGFVWQGLWSGYVLHQPFEAGASFLDPQIENIAMQRAELGAQQARRFLSTIASLGAMDEPGLNYGVVKEGPYAGQILSLFPDAFLRLAYEKLTNRPLPSDPRDLSPQDWLSWMRWRANIMGNFFNKAKLHIKKISPKLPWGQDIYAAFAINDGTNPFAQRLNDVPTTHSFMFWRGVAEQSWSFALERVGVRDKRFHFASNTLYFTPNNPDEELLAEMVTNYAVMDGVGMLWHLNFQDAQNLKSSIERLRRLGDFILSTLPARHPIGVLYSFTEAVMRLKEAGEVPNEEIYRIPRDYAYECFALYHALRRAGFTADIVHEWEIEESGLKGRKVLWLVGIKHPLPKMVIKGLEEFVKEGGKLFADGGTKWLPPNIQVRKTTLDMALYPQKIAQWEKRGQDLWLKGEWNEASKFWRQELSDELLDEYGNLLRAFLSSAMGDKEMEIRGKGIIPGKWTGGEGRFYLLLNDLQNPPRLIEREIEGKKVELYPASDWGEAKDVAVILNNLGKDEALYILEGRDWTKTRKLYVEKGKPILLNFQPTEMKVIAVLPNPVEKLELKVALDKRDSWAINIQVTCKGKNDRRILVPLPLEVVINSPSGEKLLLHRATDSKGIYRETIPLPVLNIPTEQYSIRVKELFSGKDGEERVSIPPAPPLKLRPLPDVLIYDEGAIRSLLNSGKVLVVVIGEKASKEEGKMAEELAKKLIKKGIPVVVREERTVWRKGRYPKVFTAAERRGDKWFDLEIEEREKRQRPWEKLRVWAGENGYPPTLPDAFEVKDDLILVGTDSSSILIQALQRASILYRVANGYFPGKGRGVLEYAWSPFALGKDVILVTGSDAKGVERATQRLLSLVE